MASQGHTASSRDCHPECQVIRPPSAGLGWAGLAWGTGLVEGAGQVGGWAGLGWLGVLGWWRGLGWLGVLLAMSLDSGARESLALILALPYIGSERWTSCSPSLYLSFPICDTGITAPASQEGASQHRCLERGLISSLFQGALPQPHPPIHSANQHAGSPVRPPGTQACCPSHWMGQ